MKSTRNFLKAIVNNKPIISQDLDLYDVYRLKMCHLFEVKIDSIHADFVD